MTSTSNRNRQPQGIPVGGQFAADRKSEPTSRLNAFGQNLETPAVFAMADAIAGISDSAYGYWQGGANRALEYNAAVSAEDVSQDAMVEMWKESLNGNRIDHPAKLHNVKASQMARRQANPDQAWSQPRALGHRLLAKKVTDFQNEKLRNPLPSEHDALVEEVHAEWSDVHHPLPRGFQQQTRRVTDLGTAGENDAPMEWLDRATQDSGMSVPSAEQMALDTSDPTYDDAMDALSDAVAHASGNKERAVVRRETWNRMAAGFKGMPKTLSGQVSQRRVSAATKSVKEFMAEYDDNGDPVAGSGGVNACVRAWNRGELPEEMEESFFVAFGGEGLHVDRKDAVVDYLAKHKNYAHDLWESAVLDCNSRVR